MTWSKRVAMAGLLAASSIGGALAAASPASAATAHGCKWPEVCFYLTSGDWTAQQPTSSYREITSGFQTLGSKSRGSYAVYNSRNDDIAMLRFSDGALYCLPPSHALQPTPGVVVGIRIMSASTCEVARALV